MPDHPASPAVVTAADSPAWWAPAKWRSRFGHLATFGTASIQPDDYEWLVDFVRAARLDRVLEFGPGDSTLAFLENDCEVVTFEHDPGWLIRSRRYFADFPRVTVLRYEDRPGWQPDFVDLARWRPQIAFIDSPRVPPDATLARWHTCRFAAAATDLLILHDARRPAEQATADRFAADGWMVEFIPTEKGLMVLRRDTRRKVLSQA